MTEPQEEDPKPEDVEAPLSRSPRTRAGIDLPAHDQIVLPFELKLLQPFTMGSEEVTSITFRKFNLGIMDGLPGSDLGFSHYTTVISRMTTEPLVKIKSLREKDAARAMQIASGFLMPFQPV